MDKYNPETKCPKCGCQPGHGNYEKYHCHYHGWLLRKKEEYIWRECARCSYGWAEACLDTEETNGN